MTITCPACSNSNPPDHSFCHQCGSPLDAADPVDPILLPTPAASLRRAPDESRLPPGGSFRSGLYRVLRALLTNQGTSAYKERRGRVGMGRDEILPVAADQPTVSGPSRDSSDGPSPPSSQGERVSGGTREHIKAASYWLTRAMLVLHIVRTAAREPAVSSAHEAGIRGDAVAPAPRRAISRIWKLPTEFRERTSLFVRSVGTTVESARERLAVDSALAVSRRVEVGAVAALTLAAVFLRMWNLEGAPSGLHGDETEMALEALRSIHEGGLGIWTGVTLGHPAGYAHWMALIFRIGGADVTTMRLASAIPGVLLVPVGYLLVRTLFPFRVALLTTALLAFSFWFVIQSRVAFGSITGVFMAILAMWLLLAAVQSGRNWVAVMAGIALGLGLYTFKTFLLYYTAIWGIALLAMVVERELRSNRQLWLALGMSLVIGAPMLLFYSTSDFIGANLKDLYHVSLGSPETWARIPGLALDAVLLVHLPVEGNTTDGAPAIPILPALAAAMFWVGLATAVLHLNRRRYLLLIAGWLIGMSPVLLVPGVESRRYLLGMFFVLLIVAIGIDALLFPACHWLRKKMTELRVPMSMVRRAGLAVAIALPLAFAGVFVDRNIREVDRWRESESVRWFFSYEYLQALSHLQEMEGSPQINIYSSRHSYESSLRRFLLPDATGMDGSRELGGTGELPQSNELSQDTVFVFLDVYLPLAEGLEEQFPNAVKLGDGADGGVRLYSVYLVEGDSASLTQAPADLP